LKCIKKKNDGIWEKPSKGEDKKIKCSLEEMIMILQVLKRKINSFVQKKIIITAQENPFL
jgi:hypothetical protein